MANTFNLQVVSMDGLVFDGEAQSLSCRCVDGDRTILAKHCNLCTAVGMGQAKVVMADGTARTAACIGGLLTMMDGACRLIATTWEWSEDIDLERAQAAKAKAEELLARKDLSEKEIALAEAKLHRSLVRISMAK